MQAEQSGKKGSRWTLAILLAVFLAPLVGGWSWFYFGENFSRKNHGTLYEPVRPLENIAFSDERDGARTLDTLRGVWLLVYVGEGACDDDCLRRLDAISRVRISLSKNIDRVMPVYLSDDAPDAGAAARIRSALPTGIIGSVDAENRAALLRQLAREGENARQVLHRVYLIDPIGNLVLSYEPGADPAGIRKDLARLLRVSQIG